MSTQKVMGLYDSDKAENGWNSPLVDNRKMDLLRAEERRPIMLRPKMTADLSYDLNYLDQKQAEINRNLTQLEPGYSLRGDSGVVAGPNKLSMYDKKKVASDVGSLTEDKVSALRDAGERYESEWRQKKEQIDREKEPVGKLSASKMAVLRQREESRREKDETEPAVGKLSASKMAVLQGGGGDDRKQRALNSAKRMANLSLRPDEAAAKEKKRERERQQQRMVQKQQNAQARRMQDSDVVDIELDDMLMQLETDGDFQQLSDNEKMSWLESLFYLDTTSNSRRNLTHVSSKPKTQENNLKINRPSDPEPPSVKPSQMAKAKAKEPEVQPGVNANMISLAQSFFTDSKPKAAPPPKAPVSQPTFNQTQPSTAATSLYNQAKQQQSSFGQPIQSSTSSTSLYKPTRSASKTSVSSLQIPSNASPPESLKLTPPSPLPERAFFEPSNEKMVKEDSPEFPPPIPSRSDKSKTAMLRLMKSTTSILKK